MAKSKAAIKNGWIPNQHGAWPMTIFPPFLGAFWGGFTWVQLWLALTWLVAFFFFNVFGFWMKAKSKNRYIAALTTYGAVSGISALGLVIVYPWLLWWGIPIALCFIVVVFEMYMRRERSLAARLSAIAASSLMAPITYSLGSAPSDWNQLITMTLLLAAYYSGTVPYVKTMVRERGSKRWCWGSWVFHTVVFVTTAVLFVLGKINVLIPIAWLVLLVRAWAFPMYSTKMDKRIPPPVIGRSEVGFSILALGSLLF